MRALWMGTVLVLVATVACAAENKWRLEFSGNAASAGRIVLELTPDQGEPMRATIDVAQGRSENAVARDVRDGLRAQVGARYHVEVDDGEDVLVKKKRGEHDFTITVVENTVQGVRIGRDAE